MSFVIDSPEIEASLRREADRRGLPVEDLAAGILSDFVHRSPEAENRSASFYDTATQAEWEHAFDSWIDGYAVCPALPNSAFSRESLY